MCKYTYTFYECGHRTEDNVRGCDHYKRDGIHCDVDNPQVKRSRCEVDLRNRNGLCDRCVEIERMKADEAALRKDLERAKRLDAEEQERNRKAHEEHIRKVQRESYRDFQRQEDESLVRKLRENQERAERANAQLDTGISDSTSKPAGEEDEVADIEAKMSSALNISESPRSEKVQQTSSQTSSPPPPPPLPPTASMRSQSFTAGAAAGPPPPPLPLSRHKTTPSFPPPSYSQPPKDQNYGRFTIGTRHQPIHPSQDLSETTEGNVPSTNSIGSREPAPSARLAGTVGPAPPAPVGFSVPSGDQRSRLRPAGLGRRSISGASLPSPQEQLANELEAQWNKRGIQREGDEDEGYTSGSSVTPSQSASQIPTQVSSKTTQGSGTAEEGGMETPSITKTTQQYSTLDQKRRKGWSGD